MLFGYLCFTHTYAALGVSLMNPDPDPGVGAGRQAAFVCKIL